MTVVPSSAVTMTVIFASMIVAAIVPEELPVVIPATVNVEPDADVIVAAVTLYPDGVAPVTVTF